MKFILLLLLLMLSPANAGTITFQVTETGQTTATKTFTLPDVQIDRMVAAYQSPANVSVNGTATRAQVLNYIATKLIQVEIPQFIQSFETLPAVVPTPINPQ